MLRRLALVLVALALAACGSAPDSTGPAQAAALAAQGIPAEEPYITGTVQQVLPDGRILVVSETNQAVVDLPGGTKVYVRSTGAKAKVSNIQVGQTVSVWITGTIRESFPVQVTADVVVIE